MFPQEPQIENDSEVEKCSRDKEWRYTLTRMGARMKRELQKAAVAAPRENDYTERSTDKRV